MPTHNVRHDIPLLPRQALILYTVYPVHLAFVLLNEGSDDGPTSGNIAQSQTPLFASVIQRAGGDVVSKSISPVVHVYSSPPRP